MIQLDFSVSREKFSEDCEKLSNGELVYRDADPNTGIHVDPEVPMPDPEPEAPPTLVDRVLNRIFGQGSGL